MECEIEIMKSRWPDPGLRLFAGRRAQDHHRRWRSDPAYGTTDRSLDPWSSARDTYEAERAMAANKVGC